MKTVYKLTTQSITTYNDYKWVVGKWNTTSGKGELCGPGWLHHYSSPLIAILHNPIHADYTDPVLWFAEACGEHLDDRGVKGGSTKLRLLDRIPLPVFTDIQCVAYAIYCALEVYDDPQYIIWAMNYLSGADRSPNSAKENCPNPNILPITSTPYYAASAAALPYTSTYPSAYYAACASNAASLIKQIDGVGTIDLHALAKKALLIT